MSGMEIGLIFAILTAASFAMGTIFIRRGMSQTGESFSALVITVFIGTIYFSLAVTLNGDWNKVFSISGQALALLGGAGIVHFILGRFFSYTCIRLIGANKASTIVRSNIFFAVVLGVILFNESLSVPIILGILCITGGVLLVSIEKKGIDIKKQGKPYKIKTKGILSGLATGLFWGISPILVKPGVEEIGSPYAGAFVSFVFASLILAGILFRKGQREKVLKIHRPALIPLIIAGILITTAHLFRYIALSYSPVSLVTPFISIETVLLIILSFFLNRKLEVFTWRVIIGVVTATVGAILISYQF
jgi:drug/metabolite transporter (DMT)-like permease